MEAIQVTVLPKSQKFLQNTNAEEKHDRNPEGNNYTYLTDSFSEYHKSTINL